LRLRLMLMSVVVVLLTILPAAWLVNNLLQAHLAQDVSRQLQSDVSAAFLYYQSLVERVVSAARTAAADTTVKTTLRLQILGQLQKHLDQLADQLHLDFLVIVDPEDGKILLPKFPHRVTRIDLADHPLAGQSAVARSSGGTLLEENAALLYLLEQKGRDIDFRPVVLIEAVAPVTLRDRVLGIMLAGVMVTDNHELIRGMEKASGGDSIAIVAANRLAASSVPEETMASQRFVRFPASLDYGNPFQPSLEDRIIFPLDRTEMIYDYQSLKTAGVMPETALVIMRPVETLLQVIARFRMLLLWIFGAAVLLSFAVAAVMSRSMAKPLHAITRSMLDIRQGEKVEPIVTGRNDEIGDMVRGFNEMAQSLERRIRELGAEIKSREQTEERLAAESERLRVTLQSMEDAVFALDVKGQIVLMNRVAEQLTGYSREQAVGRSLSKVFSPIDPRRGNEHVDPVQWLEGRQEKTSLVEGDLELVSENGDRRQVTLSGSSLIDRYGQVIGAVLVVRDVSAQRRMEEELARTQKLESVGVLAGGIAHDFNNLLTAILGNLSLATMVSSIDEPHYRNVRDAEKACLRARELTHQLLTFSRGGSPVKDTVDLEQLVRESAEFVAHGSSVRLRFFVDEDIQPVLVDRGQTGQVVDNLVINAIQASPDGGFVDIHLANITHEENSSLPLYGRRYVKISVQDYGTGISREHLDKVFDPYFTTKKMGSGLGLSICFSIVKKHGGHITAQSTPGRGSIFEVYLPAEECKPEAGFESECVAPISEKPESLYLLILDDEDMVRSVASQMLEMLGHTVEGAADGETVLQMYEKALEKGQPFDVVILDLTIPGGIGGEQVISRLKEIDSKVRTIAASGYCDHQVMSDPARYGFDAVIAKPFRLDDLGRVLRKVIYR
jgi:PAS domain S-box-containing protein